MAEIVNEMQERLLPEYEQLKRFDICTDEQIRDCVKKRESYQLKITQNKKSLFDFVAFIYFEKKIHKWITEKERLQNAKFAGLKSSIASRIIRLYRDALQHFPHEVRLWKNFIDFSKKSVPHEVSGIYEKMLSFHGDKPKFWCDAALWVYQDSINLAKVKEIFFRALNHHPKSETIYKTFFDILLEEAYKMNPELNLDDNTTSEQEIGMEQVVVLYRESRKKISDVHYYLLLLERCEEDKFKNITAPLQKIILDDMIETYARSEVLWNALAMRELRGFSKNDLEVLNQNEDVEPEKKHRKISETNEDFIETGSKYEFKNKKVKYCSNKFQWTKKSLKERIEWCCSVYQSAVETLNTPEMWKLYINAMLALNEDMTDQMVIKRKKLAIAFKLGHESGMMNVEHYCTFIRLLYESENPIATAEPIISMAVKIHKSVKLYELWISMYISENDEKKVWEIFNTACLKLGESKCSSIWRLTILYYKTTENDKQIKNLYQRACRQSSPEFGIFRAEYLDFCMVNRGIQKTRSEYDKLLKLPPPSLELHKKMADIEKSVIKPTLADISRWRICYQNMTIYFGKTNFNVWIDFLKFERDYGNPKYMTLIYKRAIETLDSALVDEFVTEHTMLTGVAQS